MSTGTKMDLQTASELAVRLCECLVTAAAVARVRVVGSVRRRRGEVGDIEILIEPQMIETGLFSDQQPDLESVRRVARTWGELVKNGDRFIQVQHSSGVNIDLFLCYPPAQWGSLLAIRTGPRELSTLAVSRMRNYGLRHVDGHIENSAGELVPTPTEEDFFAAARLSCLPPNRRDAASALQST